MKSVPNNLTLTELAEALSLGKEAIRRLRKEGLPCHKTKGKLSFAVEPALAWLSSTGRFKHANALATAYPPAADGSGAFAQSSNDELGDMLAFLQGMQRAEIYARTMMDACAEADNKAQLPYLVETYNKTSRQRGDTEEKVLKVMQQKGLLMSKDVHDRALFEAGQITRQTFMAFPSAINDRLEDLSRKDRYKELVVGCKESLRGMPHAKQ